jgi:hypothetical protein
VLVFTQLIRTSPAAAARRIFVKINSTRSKRLTT